MESPDSGELSPDSGVIVREVIGEGTDSEIDVEYDDMEVYMIDDPDRFLKVKRIDRRCKANFFRLLYASGGSLEKKTCIWSDGDFSCRDKSTGIMWVAVHGTDSICAVTKAGALDVTRVQGGLVYETMEAALFNFRISVISEIEDLADPLSKLRKFVGQSIEKPFGVVSGISCIDKIGPEIPRVDEFERIKENDIVMKPSWCDEEKTIKYLQDKKKKDALLTSSQTSQASSVKYDDTMAIEFLKDKMKNKTDFTMKETIQTAVCAFQHLFQTVFEAREIEVSVVDLSVMAMEAAYKDSVQKLELSEIEEHLAVINRPSSLGSSWSEITSVNEFRKSVAELVCTCADSMKDGYTEVPLKELKMK